MNAGRDVERLITDWLVEEAPGRAPDRILDAAGLQLDRTRQRRFAAMWREPMIVSTGRLLAAAAVVLVVVIGAGLVGRASADIGAGHTAFPSAIPIASGTADPSAAAQAALEQYRTQRNAICTSYAATGNPMKPQLDHVYDSSVTGDQRSSMIQTFSQLNSLMKRMTADLHALTPPPALTADHAANIAQYQDMTSIVDNELNLLIAGDLAGAQAVDRTTTPISSSIQQFEQTYDLVDCL